MPVPPYGDSTLCVAYPAATALVEETGFVGGNGGGGGSGVSTPVRVGSQASSPPGTEHGAGLPFAATRPGPNGGRNTIKPTLLLFL